MIIKKNILWHQKLFLYTIYISWLLYPLSIILETQYHLTNITKFVDTLILNSVFFGLQFSVFELRLFTGQLTYAPNSLKSYFHLTNQQQTRVQHGK